MQKRRGHIYSIVYEVQLTQPRQLWLECVGVWGHIYSSVYSGMYSPLLHNTIYVSSYTAISVSSNTTIYVSSCSLRQRSRGLLIPLCILLHICVLILLYMRATLLAGLCQRLGYVSICQHTSAYVTAYVSMLTHSA